MHGNGRPLAPIGEQTEVCGKPLQPLGRRQADGDQRPALLGHLALQGGERGFHAGVELLVLELLLPLAQGVLAVGYGLLAGLLQLDLQLLDALAAAFKTWWLYCCTTCQTAGSVFRASQGRGASLSGGAGGMLMASCSMVSGGRVPVSSSTY